MGKNIDKRLWGVLGKQQTYFSPQKQVEGKSKTPLNANAFDSWDAKRSRFKRVDGFENAIQQGGTVIGQDTTPSVSPTPSTTPQPTPTNTPTPSITPSFTPTTTPTITPTPSSTPPPTCDFVSLVGNPIEITYTDCDGDPQSFSGSPASYGVCYTSGTLVIIQGSILNGPIPCPNVWDNLNEDWNTTIYSWNNP